ncbi:hypothetical protein JM93_04085 [Roseibium hamelinense]|uniref:Uncharacterized protein n=1 Tax=Roseibium hamelinense TaxID=150831 RepID=A0A562SFN8_9HYPH|nr:hypothetical protein JM93_04085 [Roseibium hamelinense]
MQTFAHCSVRMQRWLLLLTRLSDETGCYRDSCCPRIKTPIKDSPQIAPHPAEFKALGKLSAALGRPITAFQIARDGERLDIIGAAAGASQLFLKLAEFLVRREFVGLEVPEPSATAAIDCEPLAHKRQVADRQQRPFWTGQGGHELFPKGGFGGW